MLDLYYFEDKQLHNSETLTVSVLETLKSYYQALQQSVINSKKKKKKRKIIKIQKCK